MRDNKNNHATEDLHSNIINQNSDQYNYGNEELDNDIDTVVLLDTETNIYHRYPVQYAIDQGWISPSYLNDSMNDINEEKLSSDATWDEKNESSLIAANASKFKRSNSLIKKALSI